MAQNRCGNFQTIFHEILDYRLFKNFIPFNLYKMILLLQQDFAKQDNTDKSLKIGNEKPKNKKEVIRIYQNNVPTEFQCPNSTVIS